MDLYWKRDTDFTDCWDLREAESFRGIGFLIREEGVLKWCPYANYNNINLNHLSVDEAKDVALAIVMLEG